MQSFCFLQQGKINQTRNFIQLLSKCKIRQEVVPEKNFRAPLYRYINREECAFHLILIFTGQLVYWELLIMKRLLIPVEQLSRKIALPVSRYKFSQQKRNQCIQLRNLEGIFFKGGKNYKYRILQPNSLYNCKKPFSLQNYFKYLVPAGPRTTVGVGVEWEEGI